MYFLQILDKSVLGYAATFGLREDTGLTGSQYSLLGSIAPIAQLAWQPFSSFLIVRVPHRILMPVLILGWGIASAAIAACHDFSSLLAARFFLGLFEAGCLPLFSIITSQWFVLLVTRMKFTSTVHTYNLSLLQVPPSRATRACCGLVRNERHSYYRGSRIILWARTHQLSSSKGMASVSLSRASRKAQYQKQIQKYQS